MSYKKPDNAEGLNEKYTEQDIASNKVMAVLSYFFLLVLVPIFMAKDSPYAKFHANQGVVLAIFNVVISIASYILAYIPVVGGIISLVLYIVYGLLAILGIINAATGKVKALPIIGGITILR